MRRGILLVAACVATIVYAGSQAHARQQVQQQQLPVLQPRITRIGAFSPPLSTILWANPAVAMSPRGRVAAYMYDADSSLWMTNLTSGRSWLISAGAVSSEILSWSPNGRMLAFTRASSAANDDDMYENSNIYVFDVDPLTGETSGGPRRITSSNGRHGTFSPDGRWIAFFRNRDSVSADGDTTRVTGINVVSSAGGPERERVITRWSGGVPTTGLGLFSLSTSGLQPLRWTPDSRFIYFATGSGPRGPYSWEIFRVQRDSGAAEPAGQVHVGSALPWMGEDGVWPGLTPDGRFLVMREPAVVADASGKPLGTFSLPDGIQATQWIDGYRLLGVIDQDYNGALRSVSISGGPQHDILSSGRSFDLSPDGRKVALRQSDNPGILLTANADGSEVQRSTASLNEVQWSPDGRYILGQKSGAARSQREMWLFDLASRTERQLSTYSSSLLFSPHRWRADSRAVVWVEHLNPLARPVDRTGVIKEVALDGRIKTIRVIPKELLGSGSRVALQDSAAFTYGRNGIWVIPFADGEPKRIRLGGSSTMPMLLPDRKTIAYGSNPDPASDDVTGLEVLGIDGKLIRTIPLPFHVLRDPEVLSTDGRYAIIAGRSNGDMLSTTIYRVPLDGSRPSTITSFPWWDSRTRIRLSPDGRTVFFSTYETPPTSTLFEIDFTDVLSRIGTPRR